jgi:NCS1 family nucleobase:cation symporter-1
MPGFVASVQPSVTVPIGIIHLYYICFLVGFVISASLYCFLHFIFPAKSLQEFVKNGSTPASLMSQYQDRWDGDGIGRENIGFDDKA